MRRRSRHNPHGAGRPPENQGTNTVTPVSTATNTPGEPITVGGQPVDIAITPNGDTAYVMIDRGLLGPGTVTPIRTATNTPGEPIPVGRNPIFLAIMP